MLFGVISVHFTKSHRPSERQLLLLDAYVRQTQRSLQHHQTRPPDRGATDTARAGPRRPEFRVPGFRDKLVCIRRLAGFAESMGAPDGGEVNNGRDR